MELRDAWLNDLASATRQLPFWWERRWANLAPGQTWNYHQNTGRRGYVCNGCITGVVNVYDSDVGDVVLPCPPLVPVEVCVDYRTCLTIQDVCESFLAECDNVLEQHLMCLRHKWPWSPIVYINTSLHEVATRSDSVLTVLSGALQIFACVQPRPDSVLDGCLVL